MNVDYLLLISSIYFKVFQHLKYTIIQLNTALISELTCVVSEAQR
jgi:hypothetical protein